MSDAITSSDLVYIETLCYKFYDKFDDVSPKIAALEIRVENQIYTNPTLNKVQELHQKYNILKLTYRLGE